MQGAQRFRQAHHALRQLGWQQFGNGAGVEQLQRLIGQLAQRCLLDAFGSRVDRGQGLLHLRGAEIALHTVLRVDHLRAVFPAFGFAIGQHPTPGGQAIFHRRAEVKEAHRQDAGAVANLAGHHPAAAKGDVAVQHFAFNGGVNAGQQLANLIELGAVFVTQGEVQEEILHGMQANFCQFAALGRANARQGIERHSIKQTALHDYFVACMVAHHVASASISPCIFTWG